MITAILVIAGIWPKIDCEEYWKTTATCGVLALAFTHVFLLALPVLNDKQKWVQFASFISIGILAALIIAAIWIQKKEWEDLYYRVLAITAILTGLETLVIPILMKLPKGQVSHKDMLILEKIEGDLYKDAAGKKYHLIPTEAEMK